MAMMNCAGCGANTNPSQNFCEYCGTEIIIPEPEVSVEAENTNVSPSFGDGGSFNSLFGSINQMMESQGLDTIDFGNLDQINVNNSSQTVTTITTNENGQTVTKTVTTNNNDGNINQQNQNFPAEEMQSLFGKLFGSKK